MHEVHCMFAQNGTWARCRSENLLLAALATGRTIHCSWLLNYRWELILDIVDDARSNSLFHLLGEHTTFVFIVLESHGCDFVRCVTVLKVLQRPEIDHYKHTLVKRTSNLEINGTKKQAF